MSPPSNWLVSAFSSSRPDSITEQFSKKKEMIYPTTYEAAIDFFIALLKEKQIAVKFHRPHSGNSACEFPAVYAVDQPMSFSLEELMPLKDFLCMRDINGFNSGDPNIFIDVTSLAFQNWVEFEYLPNAFVTQKWFSRAT